MGTVRVLRQSFAGGEVAPQLAGRMDVDKVQSGLAACRNFITLPHGPAVNRPGFEFYGEVKYHDKPTRLLPFSYSVDQAFAIEMGDYYLRFHTEFGTLSQNLVTNGVFATSLDGWVTTSYVVTWAPYKAIMAGNVSNKISNGDFASDLTDWVTDISGTGTTITWKNGRAKLTKANTAHDCYLLQEFSHGDPDMDVILKVTIDGAPCRILVGPGSYSVADFDQVAPVGQSEFIFKVSEIVTPTLIFMAINGGTTTYIDDVSLRLAHCDMRQNIETEADVDYVVSVRLKDAGRLKITDTAGPTTIYWDDLEAGLNEVPFTALGATTQILIYTEVYLNEVYSVEVTEVNDDVAYELESPYAAEDVFAIKSVQSGDVITLVHPAYPPYELRRYSNANWTLEPISFGTSMAAPASCTAVKTTVSAGTPKNYTYKVTALDANGFEESLASPASAVVNVDLTITGNYVDIAWAAVTGATRYNVYKSANGDYGFIGQVAGLAMVDDNILADLTRTLPISETLFGSNNYPSTVTYFEQRKYFAATDSNPQNVWATQSASEANMNYSIPSRDSDALRFRIATLGSNQIRHIVQLQDLIVLTASNEWLIFNDSGPITPSGMNIRVQSHNGASQVQPVAVNNYLLYEQAQGGHVREMTYKWENGGYQSSDISLLAPHLFDTTKLKQMAFSRAPVAILWAVNEAGQLLGVTYVPDQDVLGWHAHSTDGTFESCCTITEQDVDALYVVVKRTIGGVVKRYIERLHSRTFETLAEAFFVDSGLTYDGPETTTLSGLDHLEGKTVNILADGVVLAPKVVSGGQVTLSAAVSKAQVGLPIDAYIQTLPTFYQDPTFGQSRLKNVNKVWVRVNDSRPFKAGPSADRLTAIKFRAFDAPDTLHSGEVDLVVASDWNAAGQVLIKQTDPVPVEIVYIATEVAIGG